MKHITKNIFNKKQYSAPAIEAIKINIEQNILAGSGNMDGDNNDMVKDYW